MEKRDYSIYMHTNKQNGKVYIGQTRTSLKERWKNGNGYNNQVSFCGAIKKYGWDGFDHTLVETGLTKEEAEHLENFYIDFFECCDNRYGYNLRSGGVSGPILSETSKQKISIAKKGQIPWNKGKKGVYSEKTLQKMRESTTGRIAWNKGVSCPNKIYIELSKDQLIELYINQNKTSEQISKIFCVTPSFVRNAIHKYKLHKSDLLKNKLKSTTTGMKWFNNGKISTRAFSCPEGFVLGRLYNNFAKGV